MNRGLPDFDELKRLAETAPTQLEALRDREVERLIADAPEALQRKLRGLQFKIDCQRELHKTPMASCLAVSKMMHESLNRLNAAFRGQLLDDSSDQTPSATIIPLSRRTAAS